MRLEWAAFGRLALVRVARARAAGCRGLRSGPGPSDSSSGGLCVAVALAGNLLGLADTSLWAEQRYVSALVAMLFAAVVGLWLGNRRRVVDMLATQVEQLRIESELREQAARVAERSRIAAEMHDVLAHRMSLIALHTGVLVTKADTLPTVVADRLALLRATSTEALSDLRDVLGALRDPDRSRTRSRRARSTGIG